MVCISMHLTHFSSASAEDRLPICKKTEYCVDLCSTKPPQEIQPRSLRRWVSVLPFGKILLTVPIMSQDLLLQLYYIKYSVLQEYNMKI